MTNSRLLHLYDQIVWDEQARKPYVVLDPNDSSSLLYLDERTYLLYTNTAVRQGTTLTVIARPGSLPNKSDKAL
jgi:hypothetical protein